MDRNSHSNTLPPRPYETEIVYDRSTHDYAMYLDGELVGFARTYNDAEISLANLRLELTSGSLFREVK